jgi:acetoacetyl-CoA reductase
MTERVALVTGGIGGIGAATCAALAASGHRVIAADISVPEARLHALRAQPNLASLEALELDVSDLDACERAVAGILADHGRLDVLVNCAGITRDSTLRKMQREDWDAVLGVNLDGLFNLCKHAIEPMIAQGYGRIVNISSINGQTGQFGQTNYAAAKAGVHGFSMALAREVAAKGVTVNSVAPGYCDTPMVQTIPAPIREKILSQIPVGRIAQPEEIARVVDFLAGAGSGYITGALVPVNGGLFISF